MGAPTKPAGDRRKPDEWRVGIERRIRAIEVAATEVAATTQQNSEALKANSANLKANTDMTQEIRDLLVGFKTLAKLAKWATAIGALVLTMWQLIEQFFKSFGTR
jgi:hypothetical protein